MHSKKQKKDSDANSIKKNKNNTNLQRLNTTFLKTNSIQDRIEIKNVFQSKKETLETLDIMDSISKKKEDTVLKSLNKNDSILKIIKKDTLNITKSEWSVSVNSGVNYFNSSTNGSAINKNLSNNNKNNNFSYNFGVYFNYHPNEKITLRVGIQYLQMRYSVEDIKITGTESQLNSFSDINYFTPLGIYTDINSFFNNDTQINISQKISYIEIPMELKHVIFNQKNRLDFSTGFSTLYLQENTIYGDSSNTSKTEIGTTNNISRFNFSVNFGLSTQFKLNKKLSLDLELNYKQYLNTYTNNGNNLAPFIVNL